MTSIITLTTDFGTEDGYVGAMKGRIVSMNPDCRMIDISHDIKPQAVLQASWCIYRSTLTFPSETVHVAVIDPGVGSERAAVLIRSCNRWYIGPDNGVFSRIILENGVQEGYRLHDETRWWKKHSSFDGLALFSPAAACLTLGIDPADMGIPQQTFTLLETPQPSYEVDSITGEVILFDRFGNAITNIQGTDLAQLTQKPTVAEIAGRQHPFVDHYLKGAEREGVAITNSDGYLEISIYLGSALERLNLKIGDRVTVR